MAEDEAYGPERLMDSLTFANVYCTAFSGQRESGSSAARFQVQIEPSYLVEHDRIDYLFDATCYPVAEDDERVATIKLSLIATFDAVEEVDFEVFPAETIEWVGGNFALFATYPYIREGIQSLGARLGLPNLTLDMLKRNEPLPDGLSIGSLPSNES